MLIHGLYSFDVDAQENIPDRKKITKEYALRKTCITNCKVSKKMLPDFQAYQRKFLL